LMGFVNPMAWTTNSRSRASAFSIVLFYGVELNRTRASRGGVYIVCMDGPYGRIEERPRKGKRGGIAFR
jgi:hypothetical protein